MLHNQSVLLQFHEELEIDPVTNKIYAIGEDTHSIYVIVGGDLSHKSISLPYEFDDVLVNPNTSLVYALGPYLWIWFPVTGK